MRLSKSLEQSQFNAVTHKQYPVSRTPDMTQKEKRKIQLEIRCSSFSWVACQDENKAGSSPVPSHGPLQACGGHLGPLLLSGTSERVTEPQKQGPTAPPLPGRCNLVLEGSAQVPVTDLSRSYGLSLVDGRRTLQACPLLQE